MTYCCSVFPKIATNIGWIYVRYDDDSGYYFTPYLGGTDGNIQVHVNFCPSCGADIRGIVITKDEFDKLK